MWLREDVAGVDRRRRPDRVAGVEDFPVRVRGTVDPEDLCRAVRRCLINDLVAAEQADRRDRRHCSCRDDVRFW